MATKILTDAVSVKTSMRHWSFATRPYSFCCGRLDARGGTGDGGGARMSLAAWVSDRSGTAAPCRCQVHRAPKTQAIAGKPKIGRLGPPLSIEGMRACNGDERCVRSGWWSWRWHRRVRRYGFVIAGCCRRCCTSFGRGLTGKVGARNCRLGRNQRREAGGDGDRWQAGACLHACGRLGTESRE